MGRKIDRMPRNLGIIAHTALRNHNKCVDKINEIIEVLNALETPEEKERGKIMTETEYLEFENMRTNAHVSTFQKERFRQANFGVSIHRDIIDGRPGKLVRHINVAGIRFAISEDSAHSILSEIERLGLSDEGDKTELNPKEHAEFLGLIKDMEEMKEAVNELIEERKTDKKYISFTKIGRIIKDVGCSFPLGISVFSKINELGFYGEGAEALLDKMLRILNANPGITFIEAFEKAYTVEDFKATTGVLKRK